MAAWLRRMASSDVGGASLPVMTVAAHHRVPVGPETLDGGSDRIARTGSGPALGRAHQLLGLGERELLSGMEH